MCDFPDVSGSPVSLLSLGTPSQPMRPTKDWLYGDRLYAPSEKASYPAAAGNHRAGSLDAAAFSLAGYCRLPLESELPWPRAATITPGFPEDLQQATPRKSCSPCSVSSVCLCVASYVCVCVCVSVWCAQSARQLVSGSCMALADVSV